MKKKNSGTSSILIVLLIIFVGARIALRIGSSNNGRSLSTWDNTYIIWSIILFIILIGWLISNQIKKNKSPEMLDDDDDDDDDSDDTPS